MTPEDIHRLSLAAHRAGIAVLEITADGVSVRLRLGEHEVADHAASLAVAAVSKPEFRGVRAPAVGVFRIVHPATGRSPVEAGTAVAKGQIVGFLQVGAALRPVTAPAPGFLGGPLAEDGAVVGYGAHLFPLT